MGIFVDQRDRLLRKKWRDADELGQELYSMFGIDGPIKIDSPVQIATNDESPALTITNNFGDGSGIGLNINGGQIINGDTVYGGSVFTYNPGDFNVPANVTQVWFPANDNPEAPGTNLSLTVGALGFQPTSFDAGAGPPTTPGPNAPLTALGNGGGLPPPSDWSPPQQSLASGNNGSYMGKVVSGTGPNHQVTIYPQGFDQPEGPTVTVAFSNLASDQSIPPGWEITGINRTDRPLGGTDPTARVVKYWASVPVWLA